MVQGDDAFFCISSTAIASLRTNASTNLSIVKSDGVTSAISQHGCTLSVTPDLDAAGNTEVCFARDRFDQAVRVGSTSRCLQRHPVPSAYGVLAFHLPFCVPLGCNRMLLSSFIFALYFVQSHCERMYGRVVSVMRRCLMTHLIVADEIVTLHDRFSVRRRDSSCRCTRTIATDEHVA
jgi:hypothetical protein